MRKAAGPAVFLMKAQDVLKNFDPELYDYFQADEKYQHSVLSFVPDENTTSPLCAAIMGSVLVNSVVKYPYSRVDALENLAVRRICELFGSEYANIRSLTIGAASRVVLQAITRRGDVVMSLDLRKKEHCNTENLVFRFVNFGIDPNTQNLDLDDLEHRAFKHKPQLIVLSPINFPLKVDYERIYKIAKAVGALVWCDISQTVSLIAGGALNSPVPYSDVVTFTSNGSMQGPLSSVILCKRELGGAIDREVSMAGGRKAMQISNLAALAARIFEMQQPIYRSYVQSVKDNARALADGLRKGGMKIICGGTDTHLVMIDTKNCAVSARGAQELLSDCGLMVRICNMLTADPLVRYEAVRFSTFPATTRGITSQQLGVLGEMIGRFLLNPDDSNSLKLHKMVAELTAGLPDFSSKWLERTLAANLAAN